MENYFSILICSHPEQKVTNLFASGLPLGVFKDAIFTPDPLFDKRNLFKETYLLCDYLRRLANVIEKSNTCPTCGTVEGKFCSNSVHQERLAQEGSFEKFCKDHPDPDAYFMQKAANEVILRKKLNDLIESLSEKKDGCIWSEDSDGNWKTGCAEMFCFSNLDGPKSNGMKFCPYCSAPLIEEKYLPPHETD